MTNYELNPEQSDMLAKCEEYFAIICNEFKSECTKKIYLHQLKKKHGNYLDIYPIVSAFLLDNAVQILNGSSYDETIKAQKREAHKLMSYQLKV